MATYLRRFIASYMETALWASTDGDGQNLDADYSTADIAEDSVEAMEKDCASFVFTNRRDLLKSGQTPERAGHDYWLNRNGHGAGFWDEGLGELGKRLSDQSKWAGTCDIYPGDDGQLHINF